MSELGPAVATVVRRCLHVQPGEDVLVVVDPATRPIGEALREECAHAGADSVLVIMDERATDGTEPPPTIAAALAAADVLIAPTTRSLSHTSACKRASDAGARRATMPGVTEDEKSLGTVRVALGASAGIGGTVPVPIHLDAVALDASLEVDGRLVLDPGPYVLDHG
jgi:leucyl aminopeptidase (aminopeptidase T)